MLGNRIRELRTAFGWNQVELAKRLNISKQTVSNWENDNIQPSVEMVMQLARIFRVSIDFLLGLDETPRLDISGIPLDVVAHIALLIDDYKNMQNK